MANLRLIKAYNERFRKNSPLTIELNKTSLNEGFDHNTLKRAFSNLSFEFNLCFEKGLDADVVLLFVDVCDFSSKELDGPSTSEYFDRYYDKIIPIIYKHGGEIDKIIGDGIICAFGPPFLQDSIDDNISRAIKCSKEIIITTQNTDYSSKIALTDGKVKYFKNKSGLYEEFTIVGLPLTELFRLESISKNECINYFDNSDIYKYYKNKLQPITIYAEADWIHHKHEVPEMEGINHDNYYSISSNKS